MTEIIPWISPSRLAPTTRDSLERFGPFLTAGLTHAQIGEQLDRSEDWVAAQVQRLRDDLARHVLAEAGDELRPELRDRLVRYLA